MKYCTLSYSLLTLIILIYSIFIDAKINVNGDAAEKCGLK